MVAVSAFASPSRSAGSMFPNVWSALAHAVDTVTGVGGLLAALTIPKMSSPVATVAHIHHLRCHGFVCVGVMGLGYRMRWVSVFVGCLVIWRVMLAVSVNVNVRMRIAVLPAPIHETMSQGFTVAPCGF